MSKEKMAKVDENGNTLKSLKARLSELNELISRLPNDISKLEREIRQKEKEYAAELESLIHLYIRERYGIKDMHEANDTFLVFDASAKFIKTYRRNADFKYTEDLENLLRREKFYAHNASSFYHRPRHFYDLALIEQLKILDWTFDESGKITGGRW